jgi:hypothetical protein
MYKRAGAQGGNQGGAQDRWTFGGDRWTNLEPGLSESGLTGVSAPAEARPAFDGAAYANTLPGVYATVAPGQQGLFDPLGFCSKPDITKAKVDFYRDAETKHGRLGMLATVGILFSEQSHPIGGSAYDNVPATLAGPWLYTAPGEFSQTGFWVAALLAIGVIESKSMSGESESKRMWDPLNFSKGDPETLMRNKNTELAFGRIGMIGAIGMLAEELATGKQIFC